MPQERKDLRRELRKTKEYLRATEKESNDNDEFAVFRVLVSPSEWKEAVEYLTQNVYGGEIDQTHFPHLKELVAVRIWAQKGLMSESRASQLIESFLDSHSRLTNSHNLESAVSKTKYRYPVASKS